MMPLCSYLLLSASHCSSWALRRVGSGITVVQQARLSSADILSLPYEQKHWQDGELVIGVDEAGRGPLAGPVVAGACLILNPLAPLITSTADSKALSEKKRDEIYDQLMAMEGAGDIVTCVSVIDNNVIDEINILQATMLAMANSIDGVMTNLAERSQATAKGLENREPKGAYSPDQRKCIALIDGNKCPSSLAIPSNSIVKGDSLCYSIALASILAKVTRDRLMKEYDLEFGQYGFAAHKGYPTKSHVLAIHKYGPCRLHRMTFKPLKGRAFTPPSHVTPSK